jgi:hypothetical protein
MKILTKMLYVGLIAGMIAGCAKKEVPEPVKEPLKKELHLPNENCKEELMKNLIPLKDEEKVWLNEETYLTINNKEEYVGLMQCLGSMKSYPDFDPRAYLELRMDWDDDNSLDLVYDVNVGTEEIPYKGRFILYTSKWTKSQREDYDKQIAPHLVTPYTYGEDSLEELIRSDEFLDSLPYPLKLHVWDHCPMY